VRPIGELYLEWVERVSSGLRSPRVKALHLPPGDTATGMDAEFCALELDDDAVGFSFVRLNATDRLLRAGDAVSACRGMTAIELARGYRKDDAVAKALGFAAINALSQSLFRRAGWLPPVSDDALGRLQPASGEHVGMIGLFPPLVARVTEARARLTVLELRDDLAGERDDFSVTLDPDDLATCEKVVSTCTVMLNDTLDNVLAACSGARYFAIIGPTAGCLPEPLFERGVDHLGGRRVVDVDAFRNAFCLGEKWGAHTAKYAIARDEYPGTGELLKRIR
jgi:uncharacterized protein (DUF4213/DUF364 family)